MMIDSTSRSAVGKQLRLLCVLAHPDDESLAVGGTLARYAADRTAPDGRPHRVAKEQLSDEQHETFWGVQEFYRAFSMAGGDPSEDDLFADLRARPAGVATQEVRP
jgi:hypothetical protein